MWVCTDEVCKANGTAASLSAQKWQSFILHSGSLSAIHLPVKPGPLKPGVPCKGLASTWIRFGVEICSSLNLLQLHTSNVVTPLTLIISVPLCHILTVNQSSTWILRMSQVIPMQIIKQLIQRSSRSLTFMLAWPMSTNLDLILKIISLVMPAQIHHQVGIFTLIVTLASLHV